jgi:hypothetical protein
VEAEQSLWSADSRLVGNTDAWRWSQEHRLCRSQLAWRKKLKLRTLASASDSVSAAREGIFSRAAALVASRARWWVVKRSREAGVWSDSAGSRTKVLGLLSVDEPGPLPSQMRGTSA